MIRIREMLESDLLFFSEIRNECANEYLHDSRIFSISETINWFKTNRPNYYIIEFSNVRIGYFRTSNYDNTENSLYIGCDIHVDYRGKGLAYNSYLKFIPFVKERFNLSVVNLEVLSTNNRAINLYKKLGFILIPERNKAILKNGKEIVSEFWTLRKI